MKKKLQGGGGRRYPFDRSLRLAEFISLISNIYLFGVFTEKPLSKPLDGNAVYISMITLSRATSRDFKVGYVCFCALYLNMKIKRYQIMFVSSYLRSKMRKTDAKYTDVNANEIVLLTFHQ